jgi:hypothetical protein
VFTDNIPPTHESLFGDGRRSSQMVDVLACRYV